MATLHVNGTQLEPQAPRIPLNRRFIFSLGVVFVIAMHFFMPNPGGTGLALSFNATTWLALSFSLAIGLYQTGTNRKIYYSKLTLGLLLCCILMTVPVFFPASSLNLVSDRLIGLWAGFLLFIILQQFQFTIQHRLRLLWFVLIAVCIEAAIGYGEYFWLKPGNLFGYDTQINRPYGIFQQPNVMASFLATGLVISGYLLARYPIKYRRRVSIISLLYCIPLITVPLLVVLASRTGWLAAALSSALLLPYLYRFSTAKRFYGWVLSLLLGVIAGIWIASVMGKGESLIDKTDLDSPRSYTFPQTLDMVIEKPFTGYGYGKFESQYILYTARQHQLNPSYPSGLPAMDHPHNELLLWAVEGGILPALAIVLAALIVLSRIYTDKKGTRLAMFAMFVPIVLHSQLEYPFYHSAIHWITFVILLYWVDQRVARYKQVSFSKLTKSALRISSLVLPIVTSFYMLTSLHTNYILTKFERTQPKAPEILDKVTNPLVWKDRFDWDIYSTYLKLGLYNDDPQLIAPYIEWSLRIIKQKPRPAFYNNLILAYEGLGDDSRAKQTRNEAQYLFPTHQFASLSELSQAASDAALSKPETLPEALIPQALDSYK